MNQNHRPIQQERELRRIYNCMTPHQKKEYLALAFRWVHPFSWRRLILYDIPILLISLIAISAIFTPLNKLPLIYPLAALTLCFSIAYLNSILRVEYRKIPHE